MLRQTLFCEIEAVRYEDGEQTAPSRRLNFSVRPLTYALGGLLAGLAALGTLSWGPSGETRLVWHGDYCGCGGYTYDPAAPEGLRPGPPDSTLLVRRLK